VGSPDAAALVRAIMPMVGHKPDGTKLRLGAARYARFKRPRGARGGKAMAQDIGASIRAALGLDADATIADILRLVEVELRKGRETSDPQGELVELANRKMVEKGIPFPQALDEVRAEHRDLSERVEDLYRGGLG
jgi:hypothetical protein